jgi:hypothetical protein
MKTLQNNSLVSTLVAKIGVNYSDSNGRTYTFYTNQQLENGDIEKIVLHHYSTLGLRITNTTKASNEEQLLTFKVFDGDMLIQKISISNHTGKHATVGPSCIMFAVDTIP